MIEPIVKVLHKPPVLCIEVLSPEDRWRRVLERVRDYQQMGVQAVWIINLRSRDIWIAGHAGEPVLHEEESLTVQGTPVQLPVTEIFAFSDEAPLGDDPDSE
ncbi:Uma2 family endonuclease [Terriglobus sp.]|uniref:Uma2 family endonuclease n=1 Tax=Terriglobus sp. TaxID=1889013 RepID=UPI003B008BC0